MTAQHLAKEPVWCKNRIEPAPERRKCTSWHTFLKAYWEVLAATDFFTIEVWTPRGLVTYYLLFVIDLATRTVRIAGITTRPNELFMIQIARNLCDEFDGALKDTRFLIMDRDQKFTTRFRTFLRREGVTPVRCPPRAPNCNTYAERFVRSIKEECLDRMTFFGVRSLRRAATEYVTHYHVERNHQGLGNRLIQPAIMTRLQNGRVERRERLGGMLNFYHREAA